MWIMHLKLATGSTSAEQNRAGSRMRPRNIFLTSGSRESLTAASKSRDFNCVTLCKTKVGFKIWSWFRALYFQNYRIQDSFLFLRLGAIHILRHTLHGLPC